MRIIDDLYTCGIKDKKLKKIISKLKKQNKISKLYVLTTPVMGDGILEIYIYNQLLQSFYKDNFDVCVVGLASNKANAMELVTNIVQETYNAGYELDIKSFLGI